jgi:hypothetical protein
LVKSLVTTVIVLARAFLPSVLEIGGLIELLVQERTGRMNSAFRMAIAILSLVAMATQQPMATEQKDTLQPTCVLTVPSRWGEFKGASRDFGLAFQDSDGTLRFIRDLACEVQGFHRLPPTYLEVRRK